MDAKTAQLSAQSKGWDRAFRVAQSTQLAPGVTLYPGAWNATIVKQDDGVVILESPISGTYAAGVLDEAKRLYPALSVKAVLSTSDSWPHVGGVRQAVALSLPVYILDLNEPLLDRLVAAPHKLHPDLLEQKPQKPHWQIVSGKVTVGAGANRMELYPLRGGATERQYMVYFPEHRLLYASDTLALNDDGSLYDPELMREVAAAVQRENVQVETVFAMHQGPVAWSSVISQIQKTLN
jgi:glyoxylase-like metal-dependent hydrolase (beta-lactamase superfamily II)